jgi:stringent starvation protein B
LHDWCTDNGFTPYLAVFVDGSVDVPREHVKNNEIVLNVGFEATSGLKLGNDFVEFRARFAGQARDICIPVDHVIAIYARENGQGMAFPAPEAGDSADDEPFGGNEGAGVGPRLAAVDGSEPGPSDLDSGVESGDTESPDPDGGGGGKRPARPALKRIK